VYISSRSAIANVSIHEDYSYLVAIYPLNLIDEASDSRNNGSLVSILESTDFMKFRVLTHCVQCSNVAVVACFTMLLELDDVDNNVIKRTTGLVGARTTTDILFHLALRAANPWDTSASIRTE
jgi:hypothetical protein